MEIPKYRYLEYLGLKIKVPAIFIQIRIELAFIYGRIRDIAVNMLNCWVYVSCLDWHYLALPYTFQRGAILNL